MLKLQAFRDNSLDGGTRKLIMIVGFSLGILAVFFLLRKIVEFGIWPDGTDISVYLTAARGVLLDETPIDSQSNTRTLIPTHLCLRN